MHRKCIPPKDETGKDCVGDPVLVRPCNEDPCPPPPNEIEEEDLPLKVKMMMVSHRPQRYETCIVKEGDLELVREDLT